MRRHPRDREPFGRLLTIGIIVAAPPIGIRHDRLAADLVKGDILRRMPRGRGEHQHAFGAAWPIGSKA